MRNLTLQDFDGRAGTVYDVLFSDGTLSLTLREVERLPNGAREDAFRLIFVGPGSPIMPQGIYKLREGDQVDEIFIVPIGQSPAGIEYEAIFG
jgi:hypothetical protein